MWRTLPPEGPQQEAEASEPPAGELAPQPSSLEDGAEVVPEILDTANWLNDGPHGLSRSGGWTFETPSTRDICKTLLRDAPGLKGLRFRGLGGQARARGGPD